jgi:tetratricopeptide (TPR) repeat protein
MRRIHEIATEYNDDWLLAYSLFLWSLIETRKQNYSEVRKHANASLRLFEEMGDTFSSAWPLLSLGGGSLAEEAYLEASGYYRRGLRISEIFGYRWLMENASKYLGKISLSLNEIDEAEYYLIKSLVIAQEIGLGREKANLLYEFAAVRVAQNRRERAVELLTLALTLPESNLARIEGGSIQDNCLTLLAKIENELPQNAYLAAVKNGQDLALDEVIIELTRPQS